MNAIKFMGYATIYPHLNKKLYENNKKLYDSKLLLIIGKELLDYYTYPTRIYKADSTGTKITFKAITEENKAEAEAKINNLTEEFEKNYNVVVKTKLEL